MVSCVMGCISSRQDASANVFQVVNIDDFGNQLHSGQLEVTDLELVFYQKGRQPVRWPLRTLRRYGFELDRFTFESGRRSPTGQGIYSFICQRAEQLVFILGTHLQVRPNCEADHESNRQITHRLSSISSGGPLSPLGNAAPLIDALPLAHAPRPMSQNIYANEEVFSISATHTVPKHSSAQTAGSPNSTLPNITRDSSIETNNNNKVMDNRSEHTYANSIFGGGDPVQLSPDEPSSPSHLYMNIVPGSECQIAEFTVQPQSPTYVSWDPDDAAPRNYANLSLEQLELECPKKALNYIVLDLEPGAEQPPRSPTSSIPPDSPKMPPGYATIDFDKTTALTHSVDPSFDDSKSSRKTRHNSNISDLPRHSSSISD